MTDKREQDLSHDLVEEIIQMTGIDVWYIKTSAWESADFDQFFGENRFEVLKKSYLIEMYPRDFEQPFSGGDVFSKFGLSVERDITFEVSYRRFEEIVGGRPREGDYLFLPATTEREMDDMLKIMHVDDDDVQYYTQGTILKYSLKCTSAAYSHQNLKTGIEAIDFSMPQPEMQETGGPSNDASLIQELSDMIIDFDEQHPFGRP